MILRWLSVLILPLVCGCKAAVEHPEIAAVLETQQAAWNVGDIDGFMNGYWQSEELMFSTPQGSTRGWKAIRDRFKTKYQETGQMGRLEFDRLTIARTAPDTADASGTFRLESAAGVRSGRFYLKMRQINGKWVIVQDFTTPDA